MSIKDALLNRGLFPETLPPCFSSEDSKRAFRGLSKVLSVKQFQKKRNAPPIPYDGTKHDGNRRLYSTPHPIPYSYICDFIGANWKTFERQFKASDYSISSIRSAIGDVARAIVVTPLSEVSAHVSKKIRHAPIILKADVAQFYHSVYTHTLCWAAHGKDQCKIDQASNSKKTRFNRLDFFIQSAQSGQTRGILVGPDAYRMVAEFLAVKVDQELSHRSGSLIIGAARHVDDFYIGVRTEADALAVLSSLRESLYEYELHVNDLKTSILSGVTPLDDPWAAKLRTLSEELALNRTEERIAGFFNEAVSLSIELKTQSPLKLAVRREAVSLGRTISMTLCRTEHQVFAFRGFDVQALLESSAMPKLRKFLMLKVKGFATITIMALALLACPIPPAHAATCGNGPGGFEFWKQQFAGEARAKGVGANALSALMAAGYAQATINADRSLHSFKLSLDQFMVKRGAAAIVGRGRGMKQKNAALFASIEQRYGVPAGPLIAIWGMESAFGSQHGNQNMLSSIATLAYDCRRPELFTDQLYAALKLIDRGTLTASQRGSMHGEIGQTQFLPKTMLEYGVGNLENSSGALTSTANYLKGHGWKAGAGYQPGEANFAAIEAWNAAQVYQKAIAIMGRQIDGGE